MITYKYCRFNYLPLYIFFVLSLSVVYKYITHPLHECEMCVNTTNYSNTFQGRHHNVYVSVLNS